MTQGSSNGSGNRIAHVVLTGGPGAGKTSALSYLTDQLTQRGWRVLTSPEAATIFITGGVADIGALAASDRPAYLAVQTELVKLYRDLRERYQGLAAGLGATKTVVLHDRGIADNAAYMEPDEYAAVLVAAGLTEATAHELYDTVVHLRSAAVARAGYDGSAYTRANNVARSEEPAAAAALDERTLAAWSGHSHLTVVGSTGSFADKLQRTLDTVLSALGDPEPVEIERKFLLQDAPDLTHPVLTAATRVDIEQIYLPRTGAAEPRLRARTLAGVTTYSHTVKTDVPDSADGARIEVETTIAEETYRMLADMRDPATRVVRKTRHLFVSGDQRFELDQIHEPVTAWLLEAELVSNDDQVDLPEYLGPAVEVTHDRAWRNRAIASG